MCCAHNVSTFILCKQSNVVCAYVFMSRCVCSCVSVFVNFHINFDILSAILCDHFLHGLPFTVEVLNAINRRPRNLSIVHA